MKKFWTKVKSFFSVTALYDTVVEKVEKAGYVRCDDRTWRRVHPEYDRDVIIIYNYENMMIVVNVWNPGPQQSIVLTSTWDLHKLDQIKAL
jgi:hypothetical protein